MLQKDPLTGETRLLTPSRAKRLGPQPTGCPFCPGNEHTTPSEISRADDDQRGWHARIFPNLFPLADHHEVLVPSPRHVTTWRDLTTDEWHQALRLVLRRHQEHRERTVDSDEAVHLFINDGKGAGASVDHVHAQLVCLPHTSHSNALSEGVSGSNCALCSLIGTSKDLLVHQDDAAGLTIAAHPAPRMGGSLLIFPTHHETSVEQVEPLASALSTAMRALQHGPFNGWLVLRPERQSHWYIELVPRTTGIAGVELGLGLPVSIVEPVAAAATARDQLAAV